jgi:hypothetical protein
MNENVCHCRYHIGNNPIFQQDERVIDIVPREAEMDQWESDWESD